MGAISVLVFMCLLSEHYIVGEDVFPNQPEEIVRRFSFQRNDKKTFKISTKVDLENSQDKEPVEFIVKQPGNPGSTQHWQVPSREFPSANLASKTLCPPGPKTDFIDVIVPKFQLNRTEVSLEEVPYILSIQEETTVTVSPTQPAVFLLKLEGNEDFLLLARNASEEVCSIVSIRPAADSCPHRTFPHEESQIIYGSYTRYQTMLQQSAILIRKRDFPKDVEAINIFLIAKRTESGCYRDSNSRSKVANRTVNITITVEKLESKIVTSVGYVVGFYLIGCLLAIIVSLICFRFKIELDGNVLKYYSLIANGSQFTKSLSQRVKKVAQTNTTQTMGQQSDDGDDPDGIIEEGCRQAQQNDPPNTERKEVKVFCSGEEEEPCCWQEKLEPLDDLDGMIQKRTTKHPLYNEIIRSRHNTGSDEHPASNQTNVQSLIKKKFHINKTVIRDLRAKGNVDEIKLSDMCVYFYDTKAFSSSIHMRSTLYVWLTVLMGIFYTLPVFQLVLHYQETSLQTGNLDICYFNFLCMHPYGSFQDFGHIFSNFSYIISGLFFVLVVRVRRYKYEKACKKAESLNHYDLRHPDNCSIPEQYGIFYAMGIALFMEGLLSGCYHICPTARNFQFDTTFMYAIAVLIFLKVYQFRHPDITHTAHLVFLVIGIALVIEVIGYFTSHLYFWILFTLIHLIIVFFFLLHIYTFGSLKNQLKFSNRKEFCANTKTIFIENVWTKKFIPTFLVIVLNICMAFYFQWMQKPGVSRYLLLITMGNMFLYVFFYICNKLYWRFRRRHWIYSERIRKTTFLYFVLSLGFMSCALFFFKQELKNSSLSPAESRSLNAPCRLLIFDNHDLWHFCSAAGLFYTFMFLLTLEDCNTGVPRNKIPVF